MRAPRAAADAVNAALGWVLAAAALAMGIAGWGWRGAVLALTVIVFWLLLQFSRSLRVLRGAAGRPLGRVPNVVMLHARLAVGMPLLEILRLTRSLGRRLSEEPEVYAWSDEGGDELRVELRQGRVARWTLQRAAPEDEGAP